MKKIEVAYHEAGHAVVGYVMGRKPAIVTIDPAQPHCKCYISDVEFLLQSGFESEVSQAMKLMDLRSYLVILAAGVAAEKLYAWRKSYLQLCFESGHDDYAKMLDRASRCVDKKEADAMIEAAEKEARRLVRIPTFRKQIERLAASLVAHTTLLNASIVEAMHTQGGAR